MTPPIIITTADDDRVELFRAMRSRESTEVLWAEGPTVVERLLDTPLRVRALLVTPSAHARLAARNSDRLAGLTAPVYVADQSVVNAIVGFDLHRGMIAAADRPERSTLDEVIGGARRLVVLEGLNDHENLGAIARSARALGADGLLLDPTCADPYYRRSVRVSMGEMLHLKIARAPLPEVLERLSAHDVAVWALTPRRDATPIGSLAAPERLALLFGAEGPGLSAAMLERCVNVRIPIRAEVDSLNVGHAVTATLALAARADTI